MTAPFRIHLCTWNVADMDPPSTPMNYLPMLGLDGHQDSWPGLISIGLEEVKNDAGKAVKNLFFDDEWALMFKEELSKNNYVMVKYVKLGAILLLAFIKQCFLPFISNLETCTTKTGLGGFASNKGGVSIRMDLFGVNIVVVNCHLAAHMHKVNERIEDYMQILEGQSFENEDSPNILDHDYVYWMGDLNFRIDGLSRAEVIQKVEDQEFKAMWKYDQLKEAKQEGLIMEEFEEGDIDFPPSYKFDIGTDVYDSSEKQRHPAWTDRILWRVQNETIEGTKLNVEQLYYTSLQEYTCSDHKPVVAQFDMKVLESVNPSVVFGPTLDWHQGEDEVFTYSIQDKYVSNGWDWIGIYKADFNDMKDYETYMWPPAGDGVHARAGISQTFDNVQVTPGDYRLCYVDSKKNVRGISDIFQVHDEFESSSTDVSSISDHSSDEL